MVTTLNTALRFELVGQEALVHDPAGGLVVRLTGAEYSVIVRLTNGEQIVDPTEVEQAAIDRLLEAGIVLKDNSSSMFSRRRVMQLSAAGVAAAGLTYLVLPSAAAAQSSPPPSSSTSTSTTSTTIAPPSPDTADASTSTNLSGLLSVRWGLDGSTPFNYTWLVEVAGPAPRTFVADGTAAANGFVSTGVTIPADTTYRVTMTAPGPLTAVFNVIGPVGA